MSNQVKVVVISTCHSTIMPVTSYRFCSSKDITEKYYVRLIEIDTMHYF